MISVILTPLLIALIVILPLIVISEPIKTYRKMKTPPCRTCKRYKHFINCNAKEYMEFIERLKGPLFDGVFIEEVRGTRWCHFEPKE